MNRQQKQQKQRIVATGKTELVSTIIGQQPVVTASPPPLDSSRAPVVVVKGEKPIVNQPEPRRNVDCGGGGGAAAETENEIDADVDIDIDIDINADDLEAEADEKDKQKQKCYIINTDKSPKSLSIETSKDISCNLSDSDTLITNTINGDEHDGNNNDNSATIIDDEHDNEYKAFNLMTINQSMQFRRGGQRTNFHKQTGGSRRAWTSTVNVKNDIPPISEWRFDTSCVSCNAELEFGINDIIVTRAGPFWSLLKYSDQYCINCPICSQQVSVVETLPEWLINKL